MENTIDNKRVYYITLRGPWIKREWMTTCSFTAWSFAMSMGKDKIELPEHVKLFSQVEPARDMPGIIQIY